MIKLFSKNNKNYLKKMIIESFSKNDNNIVLLKTILESFLENNNDIIQRK